MAQPLPEISMFRKKRATRPAPSVTASSLYNLIKAMPEWRIRTPIQSKLDGSVNLSLIMMGSGFVVVLGGVAIHQQPVAYLGLASYLLGTAVFSLTNLVGAAALIWHFLHADRVVTSMLDGLWRQERRRLLSLATGPINMAAARARWIKVQAQVLDRRVAFLALLGAGILAASKILQAYVSPFADAHWRLFIEMLPHLAAFSGAIPALHFHSLSTKLIRLEHQVSEVAAVKPADPKGNIPIKARSRMRTRAGGQSGRRL